MKKLLLAALLLLLAAAPTRAHRHIPRDLIRSFAEAWNKHDAAAMADLWTEDGDLFYPFDVSTAKLADKRAGIRQLLEAEHKGTMKNSTYDAKYQTADLRSLGAEFAVVDFGATLRGVLGPSGEVPPIDHRVTIVVRRSSVPEEPKKADHTEHWSIVSMRILLPYPPPSLRPPG